MAKKFKKRLRREKGSMYVEDIDVKAIEVAISEVKQLESVFKKTNIQVMDIDRGVYGVNTRIAQFSDTLKEINRLDAFDVKDVKEYSKYINMLRGEIESSRDKLINLNASKNKIAENYYTKYMEHLKEIRTAEAKGGIHRDTIIDATRRKMKVLKQEHNESFEAINKQITSTNNIMKQTESTMKRVKTASNNIFSPSHTGLAQSQKGLKSFSATLSHIGATYATLQAGMYMYRMGLGGSIERFEELEDKVFELGVVAGKTVSEMTVLREELLRQASNSRYAAGEISDSLTSVIRTGKNYGEAMDIVTESTKLATASFADLGYATETVNKTMVSFEMSSKKAKDVVEAFHNIVLSTPLDLEQLNDSLRQSASGFGAIIRFSNKSGDALDDYKVSVMETMSVMTGLQALMGRSGSQAGTTLKMFTSKLLALTPAAKKQFDEQMKAAGGDFSSAELSNLVKRDLDSAINKLSELYNAGTLSYEVLMKMFGTRHVSQISNSLSMIDGSLESTKDQFLKLRKVEEDAILAQESWASSIKKFRNSFTNMESSMVNLLDGPGKDMLDFLSLMMNASAELDRALGGMPSTIVGLSTSLGPLAIMFSKIREFSLGKAVTKDMFNAADLVKTTGVLRDVKDFYDEGMDMKKAHLTSARKIARDLIKLKKDGIALDATQLAMYNSLTAKEVGFQRLISIRAKMMTSLKTVMASPYFMVTAALVAGTAAFYAIKRQMKEAQDRLESTRSEIKKNTKQYEMFEKQIESGSVQIMKSLKTQTDEWYNLSDGILYASKSLNEFFSTDMTALDMSNIVSFDFKPEDVAEFIKKTRTGQMTEAGVSIRSQSQYERFQATRQEDIARIKDPFIGLGYSKDLKESIKKYVDDDRKDVEMTLSEYTKMFGEDLREMTDKEILGMGGRRVERDESGNIIKVFTTRVKEVSQLIDPLRDNIEISIAVEKAKAEAMKKTITSIALFQSALGSFANELKTQERNLLKDKLKEAKTYELFLASMTKSEREEYTKMGLVGQETSEQMFYRRGEISKYGGTGVSDMEAVGMLLKDSKIEDLPEAISNLYTDKGELVERDIFKLREVTSGYDPKETLKRIKSERESINLSEDMNKELQRRIDIEKSALLATEEGKKLTKDRLEVEAGQAASKTILEDYGPDIMDKVLKKIALDQEEMIAKALTVAGKNFARVFEDKLAEFEKAIDSIDINKLEQEIKSAQFFGDTEGYYEKIKELNNLKYENELSVIAKSNENIIKSMKEPYEKLSEKSVKLNLDTLSEASSDQILAMRSEIEATVGKDGIIKEGYKELYEYLTQLLINRGKADLVSANKKLQESIEARGEFIRGVETSKRVSDFGRLYSTGGDQQAKERSAFMNLQKAAPGLTGMSINQARARSVFNRLERGTPEEMLDEFSQQMFGGDFKSQTAEVQDALVKLAETFHNSDLKINESIANASEGLYNFSKGLYGALTGGEGFKFSGEKATSDMFAGLKKILDNRNEKEFRSGLQDVMVNMSLLVADFSNMKFADMIDEQRQNLKLEEDLIGRQIKLADTERERAKLETKLINAQVAATIKMGQTRGKQQAGASMLGMLKQGYQGYKWLQSDEGAAAMSKVKGWFGGGETAGATTGGTTAGGATTTGASTAMGTAGAAAGGIAGGVGIGMALSDGFQMEDAPALATGAYGAYAGGTALASGAGMGAMAGLAAAGALAGVGIIAGVAIMQQMGQKAAADAAKKANKQLEEYEQKQYEEQMIDILKEQTEVLKGIKSEGLTVGFDEAFKRQLMTTPLSATSTELFKTKYISGGWFGSGTWAKEAVTSTVNIADFGFRTARSIEDVYSLMNATFGRTGELQKLIGSRGRDEGGYGQRKQWAMWQAELEATRMLFGELRDLQKSYIKSLDDLYTQYFGFDVIALNKYGEIAQEGEAIAEYQTSFWKDREKILKAISDDFLNSASTVGSTIANSFVSGITSAMSQNDFGLNKALSDMEQSFLKLSNTYIDSQSLQTAVDYERSRGAMANKGMLSNIIGQYEKAGYGNEDLFKSAYAELGRKDTDFSNIYDLIDKISETDTDRSDEIKGLIESLSKVEEESSKLEDSMQEMVEEWVKTGGKLSDLTDALNSQLKGLVGIIGGSFGRDSVGSIGDLKGFFESYLLPDLKDSIVNSMQDVILNINTSTTKIIDNIMSGVTSGVQSDSIINDISKIMDFLSDPEMYTDELGKIGMQDDDIERMIRYLKLQEEVTDAVFKRMTFDEQISKLQKDMSDEASKYIKIMADEGTSSALANRQRKTLESLNSTINDLEETMSTSEQATKDFTTSWASGIVDGMFETVEGSLNELSRNLFQSMMGSLSSENFSSLGTSIGSTVINGITESYNSYLMNNVFKDLFADINTIAFQALGQIDEGFLSMDTIHELSQQVQSASIQMESERQKVESALSMFDFNKEITYDKMEKEISYSTSSTKESVYNVSNYNTFEVGNLVSTSADLEYFAQIFAPYMQQAFRDMGVGNK